MSALSEADRVKTIQGLELGDHACWVYPDDGSFRHGLAGYIAGGLRSGQRVECYLAPDRLDTAEAAAARIPEAPSARATGALVLGSTEDAYVPGGTFDPGARLQEYSDAADRAIRDGFTGLRVLGQADGMLSDPRVAERWPAYELRADMLVARKPLTAVCAYDARRCDPSSLDLLHAIHARSLAGAPFEPLFHLHGSPTGGLVLDGELDFSTATFVERVCAEASADVLEPVLDLSGLRFVDGAGMRAVVKGVRTMARSHPRIRIHGAGPMFKRLWTMLECDRGIESDVVLT